MSDLVRYEAVPMGPERLGSILVKSGFFKDTTDEAKAIVKVLYGSELGFGPISSMTGIYIVEGKLSMSAQLIASVVQKSGVFSYRVREWTDEFCKIEFFERGESVGFGSFSIQDAARANLAKKVNWSTFPKAMLWARAMSQGARAFCPSLFNGAVYSVEELHDGVIETTTVTDTATGEVTEVEQADMVRSADDPLWQRWLALLSRAQSFGLNPEQIVLPVNRSDLKAYAETVQEDIKARKAMLTSVGG
jgi:hypothetical protein